MITPEQYTNHFTALGKLPFNITVTRDELNRFVQRHEAFQETIHLMRKAHKLGGKVIVIGNGGSAAVASHMAIDYAKNGGVRMVAFNDASALTCASNDFGQDKAFMRLFETYAEPDDVLIAISSSGQSMNIINAAIHAVDHDHSVITFSGFSDKNLLRRIGTLNYYVPAQDYGSVEITHLALLHAMLDMMTAVPVKDDEAEPKARRKKEAAE